MSPLSTRVSTPRTTAASSTTLTENPRPDAPAQQGVLVLVARVLKDAEEDEPRRHGRVQHPEEDERRDHEGEGDLLVRVRQGADDGGCDVLVA